MTVDHERVKEIREEIWKLAQEVRAMKRKKKEQATSNMRQGTG